VRAPALLLGLCFSLGLAASARAAPALPGRMDGPPWARDPECFTMLHFGDSMSRLADLYIGGIAAVVPNPGLRWQAYGAAPRATLSWPWSIPFGPVGATSWGTCDESVHRPSRVVLEPGLTLTSSPGFFLRAGYRFLWQRDGRRVGFGGGLGSTAELRGPDTPRASVSPEVLVRYGRCCWPGYLLLSIRYDYFPDTTAPSVFASSVGVTFW
jgi:hypothetical protein